MKWFILWAVALVFALTACASPPVNDEASGTVTITAGSGIGKPMLGQTRSQVTKELGAGVRVGRGVYTYKQADITLKVNYARSGPVTSVTTGSSRVTLLGQPLSKGYAYFKKQTNWSAVQCGGSPILFHWTKRTHGETRITWNPDGELTLISIDLTSTPLIGGGCAVGSS